MLVETRRQRIIDILKHSSGGAVTITDLSLELGVSEMTIRRDLDWLSAQGILTRVHGGALAALGSGLEKSFDDRLREYDEQKSRIGRTAAQLVKDGDRIILDAGTTIQQLARHLTPNNKLTVITNNLAAAQELSPHIHVETIVLGGTLKQKELCTVGGTVIQTLSYLSADKLFLSTAGFTIKNGTTEPDLREVEVKQAMIQAAETIILVADSSKFGITELVKVTPLTSIKQLVTDDALPLENLEAIENLGIEVITPEHRAIHYTP